jgi:hypothetical protein
MTTNFVSPLSFVAVFGSGIRNPRSGIRDPGWVKIRIRDKHPGSATLVLNKKQTTSTQYHFSPLLRRYLHLKDLLHFGKRIRMRIKVQSWIRIRITSQSNLKLKLTKNGGKLIHILQCLLQNSAKAGVF